MEISHGPHCDPKMLEQSSKYLEFRPIHVWIHMQGQYAELVLAESIL